MRRKAEIHGDEEYGNEVLQTHAFRFRDSRLERDSGYHSHIDLEGRVCDQYVVLVEFQNTEAKCVGRYYGALSTHFSFKIGASIENWEVFTELGECDTTFEVHITVIRRTSLLVG